MRRRGFLTTITKGFALISGLAAGIPRKAEAQGTTRTRRLIDEDWRFIKGDPPGPTVSLLYDLRSQPAARGAQPTPPPEVPVVKSWILPTGNSFLKNSGKRFMRPTGNLGDGVAYIATSFDDNSWRNVNLPHDYAIEGPFTTTGGGGMGRLPS